MASHINRDVGARTHSNEHVRHDLRHPNNSRAHQEWAQQQTLHVAAVYINPRRWLKRRHLFNDFRRHMELLPNVKLHVGELAYGNRPFEVTSAKNPLDFQFRTGHELWHKENVLNLVIRQFSPDWQYGAYVDGDWHFTRQDVALETIHMLQHHPWVQMFSTYCDLGPDQIPLRLSKSFGWRWMNHEIDHETLKLIFESGDENDYDKPGGRYVGATGGAWAFRRNAFNDCGGLLETCILGSGDWHMAYGLVGRPDLLPNSLELSTCGKNYVHAIRVWQRRAARATLQNVGCVNGHAMHNFHGSKVKRGYGKRWELLRDNNYDPYVDIVKDGQGIYQLEPHLITLRDGIRRYLLSRNEDDISISDAEQNVSFL